MKVAMSAQSRYEARINRGALRCWWSLVRCSYLQTALQILRLIESQPDKKSPRAKFHRGGELAHEQEAQIATALENVVRLKQEIRYRWCDLGCATKRQHVMDTRLVGGRRPCYPSADKLDASGMRATEAEFDHFRRVRRHHQIESSRLKTRFFNVLVRPR
jgi:hypothetical protein